MTTLPVDLHVVLTRQESNLYVVDMQLRSPSASTPGDPLVDARPKIRFDEEHALTLTNQPVALGAYLGQTLLADPEIRAAWRWCRHVAAEMNALLRLRLELDDGLQHLPWEALDLPGMGVAALSERILFSRFLPARQLGAPQPRRGALRAVLAVAAPDDLDIYDLETPEADRLLKPVQKALKGVKTTVVPATHEALQHALREGCDILYLASHGRFSKEGSPALFLENKEGLTDLVRGEALVEAIESLQQLPQLVVLVSCQSAGDGGRQEVADALGPQLVRAGVPAVVAMRGNVTMETANLFFPPFFESLLREGFVDRAMAAARQTVHLQKRDDSLVPLLFMRSDSGRLFTEDPILSAQKALQRVESLALFSGGHYISLPVDVISIGGYHHFTEPENVGDLHADARDLALVIEECLTHPTHNRPEILFLVGSYGSNRTTQLQRVIWSVVQREDAGRLPIYIDLRLFPRARRGSQDPILHLIHRALGTFWPDITKEEVEELLDDPDGPRLHFLFDRSEDLPDGERERAWKSIALFSAAAGSNHGRHDYIITAVPPAEMRLPKVFERTDVVRLYLQPLSLRKVRRFLYHWGQNESLPSLYEHLVRARLTDLITVPFFMVRFLLRARLGELAPSRAAFIQELLDDAIIQLADKPDMATHAMPFLRTLAWEMNHSGVDSLPLDDVYTLLEGVRGQREYRLTNFVDDLVKAEVLTRIGADRLGFSYVSIQDYCCAVAIQRREEWEQVIDQIVVTLGNETRRRRWAGTLIFLASIYSDSESDFTRLMFKITNSADYFQSDLIFLTARCLMQGRQLLGQAEREGSEGSFVADLERQVIDALAWRLDPKNEPRPVAQEQAVELLGQLGYVSPTPIVPRLVRAANHRVRISAGGERDFHFSNVRFMALTMLERLYRSARRTETILNHHSLAVALEALEQQITLHVAGSDPDLLDVLEAWSEPSNIDVLREEFTRHVDAVESGATVESDVAGLAAMALGDLSNRLRPGTAEPIPEAEEIVEFLGRQLFELSPRLHDPTLWAVTHALAMGPVETVDRRVVRPFVQADLEREDRADSAVLQRHKYMAYLVGRLRLRSEEVYDFLEKKCLQQYSDMRLWVSVIDALGWIADRDRERHLPMVQDLAVGRFRKHFPDTQFDARESLFIRRRALGVLAEIGGRESLVELRNAPDVHTDLLPELHRTRHRIILRLEEERQRAP